MFVSLAPFKTPNRSHGPHASPKSTKTKINHLSQFPDFIMITIENKIQSLSLPSSAVFKILTVCRCVRCACNFFPTSPSGTSPNFFMPNES